MSLIQNKNKYSTTSNILTNIWLQVLIIVAIIVCILVYSQNRKLIYLLLSIVLTALFTLSIVAGNKIKGRLNFEKFWNFISLTKSKKVEISLERLTFENKVLKNKNKFIFGFQVRLIDLNSQTEKVRQIYNQEFERFVNYLPVAVNLQIKTVKSKAKIPSHFENLSLEISKYSELNEYNYYFICSTKDKNLIEKACNYIKDSYLEVREISIDELLDILTY